MKTVAKQSDHISLHRFDHRAKKDLVKVGISVFGLLLAYLENGKSGIVKDFLTWTIVTTNDLLDRKNHKYIVQYDEILKKIELKKK